MDSSKAKANAGYEDFEVHIEWVHEAADDTLIAYLPGFKKEQLKVQVTTGGKLRIFGERPVGDGKISRFHKEIPIPSNCDQNKIRANFRGGMLHIKLPKLIVPADHKPPPQQEEATTPSATTATAAASNVPKTDPQPAPPQPPTPADHHEPEKQAAAEKAAVKDKAANEAEHERAMEKLGDEKEKTEAKKADGVDKKKVGSDYKQVVEGMVKGVKNPRKVMNMVLGALMAVVVAVYIRNLIRSLGSNIYN